jgi:hypothetical protein
MAKKANATKKKITKANMADTLRSLYESCFVKTKDTVTAVKRLEADDERLMLKDPQWAYLYSKYVMQAPWNEKDEEVFFGHPKWAYLYSVFVHPSEGIRRQMMACAIKDSDDEWAKKYFDTETGVDAIRAELKDK